jgi:hypothetical protein
VCSVIRLKSRQHLNNQSTCGNFRRFFQLMDVSLFQIISSVACFAKRLAGSESLQSYGLTSVEHGLSHVTSHIQDKVVVTNDLDRHSCGVFHVQLLRLCKQGIRSAAADLCGHRPMLTSNSNVLQKPRVPGQGSTQTLHTKHFQCFTCAK